MKLIMTKGLPASGKTTWSKKEVEKSGGNIKRINKDDIRSMVDAGLWGRDKEKHVIGVRDTLIEYYLGKGMSVIVDDTNFSPKHETRLKELAAKYSATFETKDFTSVPLEECIKRDTFRSPSVGRGVIVDMYKKYIKKIPVITYNPSLPDAIICDIDGTLALFGSKNPYERDFENDIPNGPVVEIVKKFKTVVYVSGRMKKNFTVTAAWLTRNGLPVGELFMRGDEDMRKDSIMKKEIYEQAIRPKYNVLFVLDDRDQVVEMWRDQGLTCLQVAEGDF